MLLISQNMLKHWRIFGLALVINQCAWAMPDDRKQVAQLTANTADLNQQTHRGEYTGDVQFDQGTTHLRALKAITEGNAQNKLVFAVAFGDKDNPAHYWEQTAIDKPLLHAYAGEIRYYPGKHLIELVGDARVVQGDDSFSAPQISYDTLKQHVLTKNDTKNRTVIIIHPGKKP
ncbi:MAG: lipopolysaccharide transport periplasmic protein LptA [Legionella sp.]|nr:lipopolysaccharide transport periplasmic protein LptA [Legionella sp.]